MEKELENLNEEQREVVTDGFWSFKKMIALIEARKALVKVVDITDSDSDPRWVTNLAVSFALIKHFDSHEIIPEIVKEADMLSEIIYKMGKEEK